MSHKYNLINSVNFLEFIVLSLYTLSLYTSVPIAFVRTYAIRALFCCLCCAHTHEIYFCRFSAFLISSEKGEGRNTQKCFHFTYGDIFAMLYRLFLYNVQKIQLEFMY